MTKPDYRFQVSDKANPDFFVGRAFCDQKEIGHVLFKNSPDREGRLEIARVVVDPRHQQPAVYAGLVKSARDHAESLGYKGLKLKGFNPVSGASQQNPDMVSLDQMDTEEFKKSFKGLATAGAMAVASAGLAATPAQAPKPQAAQMQQMNDFGSKPEDRFLWSIMQVESSGGKNFNHKRIQHGIQAGTAAIGRWGLMPNTVQEILARRRHSGKLTPSMERLAQMKPDDMKAYLEKNPTTELGLARDLAGHVLNRFKFDKRRAAYAWHQGHNLKPEAVTSAVTNAHPYVKMFDFYHSKNPIKGMTVTQKNEQAPAFASKVRTWYDRRIAQERKHLPRDNTFTPDPGRIAPMSPDPVGPTPAARIKEKIKQAKSSIKKP